MDRPLLTDISIKSFGPIDSAQIALSPVCTLFVGGNGNGKSMLTEAISWALYSTTIRSPRSPRDFNPVNEQTEVRLEFSDGKVIERSSKRGLVIDGVKGSRENNAVVQSAFGTHRAFLTTRVFHRNLLVKFAAGSDSDRRAILEELLDIEAFDKAYATVRGELSECSSLKQKYEEFSAEALASMRTYKSLLCNRRTHKSLHSGEAPRDALSKAVESLRVVQESWSVVSDKRNKLKEKHQELSVSFYEARQEVAVLNKTIAKDEASLLEMRKLIRSGKCPTCGSVFAEVGCSHLNVAVVKAKKSLKSSVAMRDFRQETLVARQEKIQAVARDLGDAELDCSLANTNVSVAHSNLATAKAELKAWEDRVSQYEASNKGLEVLLKKAKKRLGGIRLSRIQYSYEVNRLYYLLQLFSKSGARVFLVTRVYKALAKVASELASSIYGRDVVIEILDSDRIGGVVMAIAVDGGPFASYRALSCGEQGVLDFSVLRAIGDISKIGSMSPAPYIYDDILDAMDSSVASRVAAYIVDGGRQSLVLTHADEAVSLFSGATVYDVSCGVFVRRS